MNAFEFWLMERAIDDCVYLRRQIATSKLQLWRRWNAEPPEDLQLHLVNALDKLQAEGSIAFQRESTNHERENTRVTAQDLRDFVERVQWHRAQVSYCRAMGIRLKRKRRKHSQLVYYVTPEGGERWIEEAAANWDLFFVEVWDDTSDPEIDELTVTAGSLTKLRELRNEGPELWGMTVVSELESETPIVPWDATYWKQLPRGYRWKFHYRDGRPENLNEKRPLPTYEERILRQDALDAWFRRPDFG